MPGWTSYGHDGQRTFCNKEVGCLLANETYLSYIYGSVGYGTVDDFSGLVFDGTNIVWMDEYGSHMYFAVQVQVEIDFTGNTPPKGPFFQKDGLRYRGAVPIGGSSSLGYATFSSTLLSNFVLEMGNDVVYVVGMSSSDSIIIVAVKISTMTIEWVVGNSAHIDDCVPWILQDSTGNVYLSGGDSNSILLSYTSSGVLRWELSIPGSGTGWCATAIDYSDVIYVLSSTELIKVSSGGVIIDTVSNVNFDGACCAIDSYNAVYCYNSNSLQKYNNLILAWEYIAAGEINAMGISPDNTIIISDTLGHLTAINPDMTVKWNSIVDVPAGASLCIDSLGNVALTQLYNGRVIIGCHDATSGEQMATSEVLEVEDGATLKLLDSGGVGISWWDSDNVCFYSVFPGRFTTPLPAISKGRVFVA